MTDTTPRGVGLYLRRISERTHGGPQEAAKKAVDHGLKWVSLLFAWQDRDGQANRNIRFNESKLHDYAQAFKEAGLLTYVWGFPRAGWEDEFDDHVKWSLTSDHIDGVMLDPEIFYKWKRSRGASVINRGMRGTREAIDVEVTGSRDWAEYRARKLVRQTVDALKEKHGLGVTSYGIPAYHSNFPWDSFGGYGWGSPQLYSVGKDLVDHGIKQWLEFGWTELLPSVPTFGVNSGRSLEEHLERFDHEAIRGIIAWSWRQTDKSEWRVLEKFADKWG